MLTDENLFDFNKIFECLNRKTKKELSDSFFNFSRLLNSPQLTASQKDKIALQLSAYLKKKSDEIDPVKLDKNSLNLRKIRNELAHGKYRRDADFSPLYATLWKKIIKLSDELGTKNVENLLSYALRVENLNMADRGLSPTQMVAIYRPIFNSFSVDVKREVFSEILLRLFSDSLSMALLDSDKKK